MPLPRYLSQRIQDFPSPGSPGWLKNTQCESHDVVHRLLKKSHCPQVPRARHLWTSVLLAMAPKLMCLSFARVLRYECISLIFQDCSSSGLLKNRHCPLVPRARHLLTRVLKKKNQRLFVRAMHALWSRGFCKPLQYSAVLRSHFGSKRVFFRGAGPCSPGRA